MRINTRIFDERMDMLGDIKIPNCPNQFKNVAERLIMMATKPGYSVPDYHNMSQLDKILTLHFWREYDGLNEALTQNSFGDWFLTNATLPDLISRAIRWLISHNYLIIKPSVSDNALKAAENFRKAVAN